MEVKSRKTEAIRVATITHVGSYGSAAPPLFEEIEEWLRRKQLKIAGPLFGWFFDNPEKVPARKLRSEVGIPFKGEAKPEGQIEIKETPAQDVLYVIHKGPYPDVGPAYSALFQHAQEKGYTVLGCPMEIYLNDPGQVPESELLTEVQLPIKKQ